MSPRKPEKRKLKGKGAKIQKVHVIGPPQSITLTIENNNLNKER